MTSSPTSIRRSGRRNRVADGALRGARSGGARPVGRGGGPEGGALLGEPDAGAGVGGGPHPVDGVVVPGGACGGAPSGWDRPAGARRQALWGVRVRAGDGASADGRAAGAGADAALAVE